METKDLMDSKEQGLKIRIDTNINELQTLLDVAQYHASKLKGALEKIGEFELEIKISDWRHSDGNQQPVSD